MNPVVMESPQIPYFKDINDGIGHKRTMGRHGFGSRNEDGEKLLEFAGSLDLVVLNTFFHKRESQTVTYESGGHKSQIDFVLVH